MRLSLIQKEWINRHGGLLTHLTAQSSVEHIDVLFQSYIAIVTNVQHLLAIDVFG